MMPSCFHRFMSIIPYISTILAVQVHPVSRTVSSPATCLDGYSWMNDGNGYSPCLTAAYVEAACSGNNYVQPVLEPGYSYSLPNATSGTQCYCSWSSYNLMMACSLCQGANSTWQWPEWASGCTNLSWTEQYFPSGYVLSGDASIPAWAATNRILATTWTYETFNILDANNTYQTNSSYITPGASPSSSGSSSSSSSKSKSTDVGAIVGGTIGGAAALLLLAIGAYLLYRRHIYRKGVHVSAINQQRTPFVFPGTHNRIPSDMSMSHFTPSMSGPLALYGQSPSPSQQLGTAYYSQPQATYPSLQSSASPPPRTDASVYTTQTNNGRHPDVIPMV
ncbi:hypothetical protein BDR07DRAFT_1461179 [Suillus spraguei]|nr:hypothetical protein BDR07DRAFT_1461179 [Suillus spraguei]